MAITRDQLCKLRPGYLTRPVHRRGTLSRLIASHLRNCIAVCSAQPSLPLETVFTRDRTKRVSEFPTDGNSPNILSGCFNPPGLQSALRARSRRETLRSLIPFHGDISRRCSGREKETRPAARTEQHRGRSLSLPGPGVSLRFTYELIDRRGRKRALFPSFLLFCPRRTDTNVVSSNANS